MSFNNGARSEGIIRIFIFDLHYHQGMLCVLSRIASLTQYTMFYLKKKIILNFPKSAAMGYFPRD